jgi:hypothetical protein
MPQKIILLGEVPGYHLLFFQKTHTGHRLAGAGGTRYLAKGTAEKFLFATDSLKNSSLLNSALAAFISGLLEEEGIKTEGQEEIGK